MGQLLSFEDANLKRIQRSSRRFMFRVIAEENEGL